MDVCVYASAGDSHTFLWLSFRICFAPFWFVCLSLLLGYLTVVL